MQNINFQMFTDGVHFPYDNVYTLATSNLDPAAVQLHYIHAEHILQNFNCTLRTLQCVAFFLYTCIYRNVGIRQPVSSTISVTGKVAVSRTT